MNGEEQAHGGRSDARKLLAYLKRKAIEAHVTVGDYLDGIETGKHPPIDYDDVDQEALDEE